MKHRDSQKRFIEKDYIYFVTTKTHDNFPYFREPIFCELWIEELRLCKIMKSFEIFGFCLVYDHFHMVLKPGDDFDISRVMQFLKRHFSRNANIILGCTNPNKSSSDEGDNGHCRLQVEDEQDSKSTQVKISETLIQQLDEKIENWKTQFNQKYTPPKRLLFPKFKWQHSFHDHVTRNPKDFEKHIDYTIYNYTKHGLLDDWKYTSLNYPDLIEEFYV